MFVIVVLFIYGIIPLESPEIVNYPAFSLAIFILFVDLFFTTKFFSAAWRYAADRYQNQLVLGCYTLLSGAARILMCLQIFDISLQYTNLPAMVLGVSSITFAFLLWSVGSSELGEVHPNLYQLLVISNLSGFGVVFYNITAQVFLMVKSILPLISSFVYFVLASDLYRLEEFNGLGDEGLNSDPHEEE